MPRSYVSSAAGRSCLSRGESGMAFWRLPPWLVVLLSAGGGAVMG